MKTEAQCDALTEEYRKAAKARMDVLYDMQEKLQHLEKQFQEFKKSGL